MPASLVHPQLAAQLVASGHYPNRVTIRRTPGTRNSVGQPLGAAANVDGLVDIPARVERDRTRIGDEARLPDRTAVVDRYGVALAGYYPAIRLSDMAVDELDRELNITAVDHDASGSLTFLQAEIVG